VEDDCGNIVKAKETQIHVATQCPSYQDLRDVYELETDDGLLEFYRAVLSRRKEREEDN
jgi:hypothetical protein